MKSYRPMGLFPMQSGSGLPKRTGLFGSLLSMASLNSIGDQERASFEFKASFRSQNQMPDWPYDYRNDSDYAAKTHWVTSGSGRDHRWNLEFLNRLRQNKLTLLPEFLADHPIWSMGPVMAPEPKEGENISYIYPSYIIWINDPTYLSFLGVPDRLELPKDVLRKTGGHPQPRAQQSPYLRSGARNRWVI